MPASALDIFPTVAGLAGAALPSERPLPLGEAGKVAEMIKLELYDLSGDIGEACDVAAKHPDVVKRLTQEARRH